MNSSKEHHSVEIDNLKFLDSMAFMSTSLSSLATAQIESGRPLKYSNHLVQHPLDEAQ